jgi:predicted DNA binding protein
MARASLKIKSNEALVSLSERHPDAKFLILGGWPNDEKLRVLVQTSGVDIAVLEQTLAAIPTLRDIEFRQRTDEQVLFEVSTPTPAPHGAMAESGVVPSFPLRVEDGWFIGTLTASHEQLSPFRDELDVADIDYQLIRISENVETSEMLTPRQQEVIELAVQHGYYESPRRCTLTDLADLLDVNKFVVSRILQRAEGQIITAYYSSS